MRVVHDSLCFCGTPQEALCGRTPRRRWSQRGGGAEDGALMVKSMLDLRLLDSFQPGAQEEPQAQPEEGQEEQVLLGNTLCPSHMG